MASAAALLLLLGDAAPALAKKEAPPPPPPTEYDRLRAIAGEGLNSNDLLQRYKQAAGTPAAPATKAAGALQSNARCQRRSLTCR